MHIRLTFLLSMLLLTDAVILVFLTGMIQQHGFSLIEEGTENDSNNPLGFKSIKKFDSNGNFITNGALKDMVKVNFGFPMTLLLILQITCT